MSLQVGAEKLATCSLFVSIKQIVSQFVTNKLQTATTTTLGLAGRIGGNGSHILDSSDLHSSTGQGTQSSLSTGTGRSGSVTSSRSQLDVHGSDAELLATSSHILSSKHGSVGRRLITISLHLHSSSHTDQGFTSGHIGDVNEGIVEGSVDVSNSEHLLSLTHVLGSELDLFLFLSFFLRSLEDR